MHRHRIVLVRVQEMCLRDSPVMNTTFVSPKFQDYSNDNACDVGNS